MLVLAEERSAEVVEMRDAGLGGRLSITEGYNFLTDGLGPGVTGVCQTSPQHGVTISPSPPPHAAWSLCPARQPQHLISLIWLDFFRVMYSNMLTSSG